MRTLLTGLIVGTAGAVTALAGPLEPGSVAADAKWMMHLNADRIDNPTVLQRLKGALGSLEPFGQLILVQERSNIDPGEDIHGLTGYGTGYEREDGVAILRADYDPQNVVGAVSNQPGYQTARYGEYTVHTWQFREPQAGQRTMSMALYDRGTIVFGGSEQAIQSAIDVLSGRAPGLDDRPGSPLARNVPPGTIFRGRAVELANLPAQEGMLAMLRQAERVSLLAGEQDGTVSFRGEFVGATEDAARQIEQIMAALGESLRQSEDPRQADLARGLSVQRDQRTVTVQWQGDSRAVLRAVEQAAQGTGETRRR